MTSSLQLGARRLFMAALVVALASGNEGQAVAAAGQGGTVVDTPSYDARSHVLAVPYRGPEPHPELFMLSPEHFYYEFGPAHTADGGLYNKLPGDALKRMAIADRHENGAVRVAFELQHGATPAFQVDTSTHRILFWPLGRPEGAAVPTPPATPRPKPKPTPEPMGIAPPHLDGTNPAILIIPFLGHFKRYQAHLRATDALWIDMDFEGATLLEPQLTSGVVSSPLLERWELRQLENGRGVQLGVKRRRLSDDLVAHLVQNRSLLYIAQRGTPSQAPAPSPRPSQASATPAPRPSPRPLPSPRPIPSPSLRPVATSRPAPSPSAVMTVQHATPAPLPTHRLPVPVVTPQPVPSVAPRPRVRRTVKSAFNGASYDPARQALVLPFTGALPEYNVSQASATELYVDFPSAELAGGQALAKVLPKPDALVAWQARDDGSVFRVTLKLARRGEVLVAHDAAHKQLLLIPQLFGALEQSPPPASAVTTVFVRAAYDTRTNALLMPYYGTTPLYVIEPVTPTSIYVDFLNAATSPEGVQYQEVHDFPLMTFWLLAKRPDQNVVRVAMTLPFGGHVDVMDDKANKRLLLIPQLGAAPNAAPSSAPRPRWFGL